MHGAVNVQVTRLEINCLRVSAVPYYGLYYVIFELLRQTYVNGQPI